MTSLSVAHRLLPLRLRSTRLLLFTALLAMAMSQTGAAAVISWDDGQIGPGAKNWSGALNWSSNVLPASGDDVRVGNLAPASGDATLVSQDFQIRSLEISGGASVSTTSHYLQVNGPVEIGLASKLIVPLHAAGRNTASLQMSGVVAIANLGDLEMRGGYARLGGSVDVALGGEFRGYGDFRFTNGLSSPTTVFRNNGTLRTGRNAAADATESFTLRLRADDADAFLDMDGVNNDRLVVLEENTTLDVDMSLNTFRGRMTMAAGTIFDSQRDFITSGGAIFDINAGGGSSGVPATATIRGGNMAMSQASLNVLSGTLAVESNVTGNASSSIVLDPNATLRLDGDVEFGGTLTRSAVGRNNLVINGDVILNGIVNWGLSGLDDTTINPGGRLKFAMSNFNTTAGSQNEYRGEIYLNGGTLDLFDLNAPTMDGFIEIDTGAGDALIRGNAIYRGLISISGNDTAYFNHRVRLDGARIVGAAPMVTWDRVTFDSAETHTGFDRWSFRGSAFVNANTVINWGGATFDLVSAPGSRTHNLNADWTIVADSLGGIVGEEEPVFFNINNINSRLTVDLSNGDDYWTLGPLGRLNVLSSGGLHTSLAGSDLHLEGVVAVENAQRFAARLAIQSSGAILFQDNGSILYLNGGDDSHANEILGGLVNGNGTLASSFGGLRGYGIVNADILFTAGADLTAAGGALFINETIRAADVVKIEPGATLRLVTPFSTGDVNQVRLRGGTLDATSTSISNSGVIDGWGEVLTEDFLNIGVIQATQGNTLVLRSVNAPDLDGIDGVGVWGSLEARSGNLVVMDRLGDDFSSSATVAGGFSLNFQEEWRLDPQGELVFLGGSRAAVLSGNLAHLDGKVIVDRLATIEADVRLGPTSVVELPDFNDMLIFEGDAYIAEASIIEGDGTLKVEQSSRLVMDDRVDLRVHLINDGKVEINDTAGQIDIDRFAQWASGILDIDLGLPNFGNHQRLRLRSGAELDGTLDVALMGSFMPSLGDEYVVIETAEGSIQGTFSKLLLPTLSTGLGWDVDYSLSDSVVLRVVSSTISGDFNSNGDYGCEDVDALIAEIVAGTDDAAFDLTGDGSVNRDDLTAWLAEAGAAELSSGNSYLVGDANLDGAVDTSDFNFWNGNKFTNNAAWCAGDFNADGAVDASDFNLWNTNKFQAADAVVPEPSLPTFFLLLATTIWLRRNE